MERIVRYKQEVESEFAVFLTEDPANKKFLDIKNRFDALFHGIPGSQQTPQKNVETSEMQIPSASKTTILSTPLPHVKDKSEEPLKHPWPECSPLSPTLYMYAVKQNQDTTVIRCVLSC